VPRILFFPGGFALTMPGLIVGSLGLERAAEATDLSAFDVNAALEGE